MRLYRFGMLIAVLPILLLSTTSIAPIKSETLPSEAMFREDINGNGEVNLIDILSLLMTGRSNPDDPKADYNGDGEFTGEDVKSLIRSIVTGNLTQATTYYVSPAGDDSGPGTENQPWLTIQHAAETAEEGTRVLIKAGIYNEQVVPQNSGSSTGWIVFSAFPGDTVVIDGNGINITADDGLIVIEDIDYIRISGLRVINSPGAGILTDNTNHLIIENNYTYNTVTSGIGVWNGRNVLIEANEVELACNDGEQECISVGITDTFEIKNNHVHHSGPGTIGGEGICPKDGSSNGKIYDNHVHDIQRIGIYIDAWNKHTFNIEVFENKVHDCKGGGITLVSEDGGLLENVSVFNNLSYSNAESGITVANWGNPVPTRPMKDIYIINNTLYANGLTIWGGGILLDNPDITNVVIRNNICSQNEVFQIAYDTGVPLNQLTVSHNLIDEFKGEIEGEITGSDYVAGSPLFENAETADFHLTGLSPAIDRGTSADAPLSDYDRVARPKGVSVDIGAFEYPSNREEETTRDYRQDMRDFVQGISVYAKEINPGFIVIPQNGHDLITENGETTGIPALEYLGAIDGAGREDLFYGYDEDNTATPVSERDQMLVFMDIAESNGVQVLATDYCWTQSFVDDSNEQNAIRSYISFAADHRELDNIPAYPATPYNVNATSVNTLGEAKNFLYLLNPGSYSTKSSFVSAIQSTDYDVVITDLFYEGTQELTSTEIASLKVKANGGARLIIAYMSIGEAEQYRYYWQPDWETNPPSWLAEENPAWPGNYKVRYWEEAWQNMIYRNDFSYLKRILDLGFNGVYLDIIDAYEYFENQAE